MALSRLKNSLWCMWQKDKPLSVVCLGVVIYTAFFTGISFLRYDAFSYSDFDFALFVHECWKALHGSAHISLFMNVPIWGNGLEFISIITSPFLLVSGYNPKGLLFFQSLALGASAIPVFLIARAKLYDWFAVCIALSYLFYPAIWFSNLYEYNPLVYATFTLLMAYYFLQQERFGLFMLFIMLSLLNRADVGIVTFMFGVYALVLKKPWKWVIWPSLISFVWVGIGLLVVIPMFKGPLSYDSSYPQFGKGFDEVIRNMVLHPEILYRSLVREINGRYFFEMLYPMGFFSLLDIRSLSISGLSLLQHLASVRGNEHTIHFHYTATVTPFVFISAINGLSWLAKKNKVSFIMCLLPIVLALVANFTYGPIFHRKAYLVQLNSDDEDRYKRKMIKDVPANASVVSTFEFSPMLAGRHQYYSFHYIFCGFFTKKVRYQTPERIDYALVNFEDPRLQSFYHDDSDIKMRKFFEGGMYGVVDRINSVVLLKRNFQSPLKLYDVRPATDLDGGVFEASKALRLLRVDQRIIEKRGQQALDLTFHWKPLVKLRSDIQVIITIFNKQGKQVYYQSRQVCYGVFPMQRWEKETEILDPFEMIIPSELKTGEYDVYMALLSLSSNKHISLYKIDGNRLAAKSQGNIMISSFTKP